jgi:phosphatidylcholine synthase
MAASKQALLKCCAWLIHLYTASGAIAALLTFRYSATGDFRAAFIMMAIAIFIDSTDGPLARVIDVRKQLPWFDGALLDNLVDYLNYVAAPAFLMIRAGLLVSGGTGLSVTSFMMLASAYGFCRVDAKTADHYFRGFPSYWNVVAFYCFCLGWPQALNTLVVAILAAMVFIPTKYIYPNRTVPMRPLTLSLAAIWAPITLALLIELPAYHPILLYTSLAFIVYYFVMSFALHFGLIKWTTLTEVMIP